MRPARSPQRRPFGILAAIGPGEGWCFLHDVSESTRRVASPPHALQASPCEFGEIQNFPKAFRKLL